MIELWESKIKKENSKEIPVILPLLIYHDRGSWNIKARLSEMMQGYEELPKEMKRFVPDYEYLVYDLTKYKDEDVKLEAITRIIIKIIKNAKYAPMENVIEVLEDGFKLLEKVIEKDKVTHYIESCLRYILSVRNDINENEIAKIAGRISVEGSELVMTVAEKLREEGIEIGAKQERINLVKKAIIKQMRLEDIIELTGLTEKEIEEIRKEMLQ